MREMRDKAAWKHGLWKHPLHDVWRTMKERCYNPKAENYPYYGGRGIVVCERWHSVENFVADNEHLAKPGLTIDRIDVNGHYEPGNVQWSTAREQARNRRNNHVLTHAGRTQILSAWAEEFGIPRRTFDERLKAGWSMEQALTAPVRHYNRA